MYAPSIYICSLCYFHYYTERKQNDCQVQTFLCGVVSGVRFFFDCKIVESCHIVSAVVGKMLALIQYLLGCCVNDFVFANCIFICLMCIVKRERIDFQKLWKFFCSLFYGCVNSIVTLLMFSITFCCVGLISNYICGFTQELNRTETFLRMKYLIYRLI